MRARPQYGLRHSHLQSTISLTEALRVYCSLNNVFTSELSLKIYGGGGENGDPRRWGKGETIHIPNDTLSPCEPVWPSGKALGW